MAGSKTNSWYSTWTHLEAANTIRSRLSPIIYHATLDFRKNLWQLFIQPLFEFILPLYCYEKSSSKRQKIQLSIRNTFKSFTSLKKTTKTELIDKLMGYNIEERSQNLYSISFQKWECRKQGRTYSKTQSQTQEREEKTNLCKNLPKSMIKYINMQTALCPKCKSNNIMTRCSKEHLENYHEFRIADVYEIINKVKDVSKKSKGITNKSKENAEEPIGKPSLNMRNVLSNPI